MSIPNNVVDMNTAIKTVKADAKQRSLRTLAQGAIATVVVTVLPILYAAIYNGIDKINWQTLEQTALTAAMMAFISYLMGVLRPVVVDAAGEDVAKEVDAGAAKIEAAVPDVAAKIVETVNVPPVEPPAA